MLVDLLGGLLGDLLQYLLSLLVLPEGLGQLGFLPEAFVEQLLYVRRQLLLELLEQLLSLFLVLLVDLLLELLNPLEEFFGRVSGDDLGLLLETVLLEELPLPLLDLEFVDFGLLEIFVELFRDHLEQPAFGEMGHLLFLFRSILIGLGIGVGFDFWFKRGIRWSINFGK